MHTNRVRVVGTVERKLSFLEGQGVVPLGVVTKRGLQSLILSRFWDEHSYVYRSTAVAPTGAATPLGVDSAAILHSSKSLTEDIFSTCVTARQSLAGLSHVASFSAKNKKATPST